jgi:hypothetical protein
MTARTDRFVLCMKWGNAFDASYVNVLYNAVRANLSGAFRFVCLTDDHRGLVDGIEALPLPDVGLAPQEWFTPGVWPKLGLFLADLHGLQGRALFIDLDMMILGDLEPFFLQPGGVVAQDMGEAWRKVPRPGPSEVGTCIFAFDIGGQPQIAESFMAEKSFVMKTFINEQDYVGHKGHDVRLWPKGWVVSFKRHVARRGCRDLFLMPPPPVGAAVLAFHGTPRPADLLRRGFWGEFPHLGRGPIPWVAEYWEMYGARPSPPADVVSHN